MHFVPFSSLELQYLSVVLEIYAPYFIITPHLSSFALRLSSLSPLFIAYLSPLFSHPSPCPSFILFTPFAPPPPLRAQISHGTKEPSIFIVVVSHRSAHNSPRHRTRRRPDLKKDSKYERGHRGAADCVYLVLFCICFDGFFWGRGVAEFVFFVVVSLIVFGWSFSHGSSSCFLPSSLDGGAVKIELSSVCSSLIYSRCHDGTDAVSYLWVGLGDLVGQVQTRCEMSRPGGRAPQRDSLTTSAGCYTVRTDAVKQRYVILLCGKLDTLTHT